MNPAAIRLDASQVLDFDHMALYEAVGWTSYTSGENRNLLEKTISNSTYVVAAWHDKTLVGLALSLRRCFDLLSAGYLGAS